MPFFEGRPAGRLGVTFLGLSAEKFGSDPVAAERGSLLKLFSAAAHTDAPAPPETEATQTPAAASGSLFGFLSASASEEAAAPPQATDGPTEAARDGSAAHECRDDTGGPMFVESLACGDGDKSSHIAGKRARVHETVKGDLAGPALQKRGDTLIPPAELAPRLADAVATGVATSGKRATEIAAASGVDGCWSCEACTLCNPTSARRCELCGALRGSALPAAATLSEQGGNARPHSSRNGADCAQRGAGASRGPARAGRGGSGRNQALTGRGMTGRGSLGAFFKRV